MSISSPDLKCTCDKRTPHFVDAIISTTVHTIFLSKYSLQLPLLFSFSQIIHSFIHSFILTSIQNVIDGDLCEQYPSIEYEKQRKIAEDLERSPAEVQKKLEDMRNML
jgi:hypothetical protein